MKRIELLVFGVDGASPRYVKEAVERGELPGFAKLMRKGVFFDNSMTVFPSISPTCWSSISTGAVPSVHGALCQTMHVAGKAPTEFFTPYSAANVHAERFWETAARIGKKSLIIDACCSGPAKSDLVMQIMGGTTITPDKDPGDTYVSGVPQQYFHIKNWNEIYTSGAKTPSGQWVAFEKKENLYKKEKDNVYIFPVVNTDPRCNPMEVEDFTWTIILEADGVKIGENEQLAEKSPVIKEKQWSDVITRNLYTDDGAEVSFQFRARVESFDEENKSCIVYVTAARNLLKEITPLKFAKEIEQIREVPVTNAHAIAIWDKKCDVDRFIDCEGWGFEWRRKVITYSMEHYDNDIIFDFCGLIDTVNHRFRSIYERVAENYEEQYDMACEAYKKAYQLVDDHILWLLENAVDEETTIAVVSDHGSVGWHETVDHCLILEKAGLIKYTTENPEKKNWRNQNIDWTQTMAYPVGSSYINVNLKGREPNGIVEPGDYDKIVNKIIKALHNYVETSDDHMTGLAFAVEKEQAGFVGVGGENCGDVVYGIVGSKLGGYYGQVHGNQIPSAKTQTGDIRSLCIMSGKKFKENEIIKRPVDLTDYAPTWCYALGYPQPKDATGGVIFPAYKE